ncbi:tRNA glutamyl-Q(34) synthetase GluQRS [Cypionkella sp.]|uniref:tRNA glutamyl-Q(34) synthetase GluQRS n=1 Tax=Cypionkella sp. TaxID=2811411 RepID=UPI00262FE17C|nr:tRNA glutamyl-Q(34) synthetase GluQRS [Cypionkella sp.]MDB5666564.1 tRNA glutamyl-Q(34) synthetase GluQRS [Cypionkella sp.]
MAFVTRFAPSPTGPLHLGHAYSAMLAHDMAQAGGGTFVLRIEDIDRSRCRPEWENQLIDDLNWLGIFWDTEPLRQSDRVGMYSQSLDKLWADGLIYPCNCSRRDIEAALSAPQEGTELPAGPDGLIYPGVCRNKNHQRTVSERTSRPADANLRLNVSRVTVDESFERRFDISTGGWQWFASYRETGIGPLGNSGLIEFSPEDIETQVGDFVIARRDMGTSYHLSVVLDDAAQRITHVVRGADLTEATKIHVLLQRLLGLPTPIYHHHRLIRDENGKRLAKRDDARALSKYRAEGATPADIRRMVGL